MAKWTIDNFLVIGIIFTAIWLFFFFANPLPYPVIVFDGFVGKLWTAWIVVSGLILVISILIKIIIHKTS